MKRFTIETGSKAGEGVVFSNGTCAYVLFAGGSDFLPSLRELRERHPDWRVVWIDPM